MRGLFTLYYHSLLLIIIYSTTGEDHFNGNDKTQPKNIVSYSQPGAISD